MNYSCINIDEVESDGIEELNCMVNDELAFLDSQKLLEYPNIWLADSTALIHITSHKQGLQDVHKVSQTISLRDKSVALLAKVGIIRGQICNCFGQPRTNIALKDVVIMKSGFILFSLAKMQLKRWSLHGD